MQIIGVDLHARQQTISMVDTAAREIVEKTVEHAGDAVQEFYSGLEGPVASTSKGRDRCSGFSN